MPLSANYQAALAAAVPQLANLWLELEGLPYGFGLQAAAAAWFSARSAQYQREGILGILADLPSSVEQEAKVREGDASVGSLTVELQEEDTGSVLGLVANTGRRDGWVYLGAPRWKPSTAYVATGDVVRPTLTGGGAGAGKWFRCTTGGTSGGPSAEPTWPAAGTVADGTVVWTAEADQGLPASTTQVARVPFTGVAGTALTLYLGRETLRASSLTQGNGCGYFSTVDRARYLMEGQVSAWAHTDGDVISTYPRFAVSRRGRLYGALQGCADADKLARWSGVVAKADMGQGLLAVKVELSSTWEQMNRKRFKNQGRAKLGWSVPNLDPENFVLDLLFGSPGWTADGRFSFFRCEDEIFYGQASTTQGKGMYRILGLARGVFGTTAATHDVDEEITEILAIHEYLSPAPLPENQTAFTKGDNPLSVALQIWLSKKGDATNGAYDVLPEGWGVGLDQSFVDVAGIEAIRDRWIPTARVMLLIEEPYDPRELTTKLLRPFGLYPVLLTGDKLSVRRRAPPMPDTVVRTIDSSVIRRVVSWEQDVLTQPVGLLFEADKELLTDDYRQRYAIAFVGPGSEGEEFYGEDAPTVEIQAQGLYSGAPGFDWNVGAEDAAVELGEITRDRDSTPAPIVTVECSYDVQDLEQGDYVNVTDTEIPNVLAGSRGVTAAPFEVLAKKIEDDNATITVKLQQVPRPGNARLLSPSAVANSVNVGALRIYPEEHLFGPTTGARDLLSFVVGDVVAVYSAGLDVARGTATVAAVVDGAVGVGYIQLGTWPTGTAAGDVVMLADYAQATAYRKARDAFMADASLPALIGPDPAHEYA